MKLSSLTPWLVIIIISLGLSFVDFIANDYLFLINKNTDFLTKRNIDGSTKKTILKSKIPEIFTNVFVKNNLKLNESRITNVLFSRIDITPLNLQESWQTNINDNKEKKFLVIYEFSGGEKTYFALKSALKLVLSPEDSIFEANNLGDYSFYYNDNSNKSDDDHVYLLSLIKGRVWGFEYPRSNHEKIKELLQTLMQ